jgi:hypothetical protein
MARGSNTWVAGYTDQSTGESWVAAWDPNALKWLNPEKLVYSTGPFGSLSIDLYLAWDAARGRFICVLLDKFNFAVYFGYSSGPAGTGWQFRPYPVLAGTDNAKWDFPSVAVDTQGRTVVAAVKFPALSAQQPVNFASVLSADGGITFCGGPVCNPTSQSPTEQSPVIVGPTGENGAMSRVIGTNNRFHAFVPRLDPSTNTPYSIRRFESTDGLNWTDQNLVGAAFTAPNYVSMNITANDTACDPGTFDNCFPVYFAPLLDAAGDPSGRWSLVFQAKYGARNNVMHCASDRGCGLVNVSSEYDEFLPSTAISPDGSYWVSYLAFKSMGAGSASNLISQVIRFPPGLPGHGMTVAEGAAPSSWQNLSPACSQCYAAGDYARMAADSSGVVAVPQMEQSYMANAPTPPNDLFVMFLQDPQGTMYAPYSPPPTLTEGEGEPPSGIAEPASEIASTFFDPPAVGPVKAVRSRQFQPNYLSIKPGDDLRSLGLPAPPQAYGPTPGERLRRKQYRLP